jgi:hypothetical protein
MGCKNNDEPRLELQGAWRGTMDSSKPASAGIVKNVKKQWSIEDKKRIVAETLAKGTSVGKVAWKHGVHVISEIMSTRHSCTHADVFARMLRNANQQRAGN